MALKAGRVGVAPSQVDKNGNITGGGGSSVTVVDNLNSTSSTDALSAKQGKVLKDIIDADKETDVVRHNITLSNSSLTISTDAAEGDNNFYVEVGNKVIVFLDYKTSNGGANYNHYKIAEGLPHCASFYQAGKQDLQFMCKKVVDDDPYSDMTWGIGTGTAAGELYQLNRSNTSNKRRYVVLEYYKD